MMLKLLQIGRVNEMKEDAKRCKTMKFSSLFPSKFKRVRQFNCSRKEM